MLPLLKTSSIIWQLAKLLDITFQIVLMCSNLGDGVIIYNNAFRSIVITFV